MAKWLSLAAGGVAGTFTRYFLTAFAGRIFGTSFPFGTLTVNLLGCFLAGLIVVVADEKLNLGFPARIFLITGFCGAFTTFSAFMIETDQLLSQGSLMKGTLNILVSVTAGLLLFRLGFFFGSKISG